MKATVESVTSVDAPRYVVLRSAVGVIQGVWNSLTIVPVAGVTHTVELDLDGQLSEFLPQPTQKVRFEASSEETNVLLSGVIEGVEPDGLVYFRLAEDCLIMIEDKDRCVSSGLGVILSVQRDKLLFSPVGAG